MKPFRPLFLGLALFVAGLLAPRVDAAETFELKDGDRVLFIGDTFFEREVDYGWIETRLTAAFPDRNVTFRNLGWAGDTPLGKARASFDWNKPETEWLNRVKEQVALVKPTVAFLSYGMTAALELAETKPEDQPAKLEKFKRDLGTLMDAIDQVSGQKVRFVILGPVPPDARSMYPDHVLRIVSATSELESAIDRFANVRQALFLSITGATSWKGKLQTDQWVHLTDAGYETAAEVILKTILGQFDPSNRPTPSAITGEISVLRSAILKKNELFFHRWRPQNWTYLFGFRKHEQGQNGVEIPKFDALVAEWDARIAKLRDLNNQDPATVKEVRELLAKNSEVPTPNSQLRNAAQPTPTFDVANGFEATLWAENPLLHKPIQMNWDARGRLWIASSEIYPQIAPGQPAVDSVVVLEDTDGDGRADKHTVFASGLVIPTGVLPDNRGGCYVAASHQLLHFADTDGDGVSDQKKIVLSSFGTEDTHHNLHTLRWGYDGHLYMNQSIYTHSHIETPWGVRRLNSGGIWRFNPDTWRLEVFTKGGCNPWGHHWDQYGNSFFTDGAGFKGIYHAMEGATYFTYADMRREAESISPGNYPKFASIELVHSPAFPADWQGDAITCDFRAHRVVRFKLNEVGSSYQTQEMPDLLRSTNVTFRPIDLRFGPDGALYVADWSNPIIQHGEVDFRDPRRDKEHGRIWRVTRNGVRENTGGKTKALDLTKLTVNDLLSLTLSNNGWEQEQSRVVLRQLGATKVLPALKTWVAKQTDPRAKLEAAWLHDAFEQPDPALLSELAKDSDPEIRTAAARQLSR